MTCIVGIEHEGEVHIGGDSAGVGGLSITARADTKVFDRQQFLFGFTTSFRMGQLIRYKLALPAGQRLPHRGPRGECHELDEYMATTFIEALRACLSDGGWLSKKEDRESGGTFLVGVRGTLYAVYDDFQISRSRDGYAAVGCGDELALGSLHTSVGLKPRERVLAALTAAAHHSAGVCEPFVVLSK